MNDALHDTCVKLAGEMGLQEARLMAQERVRTSIPNPFKVVSELQALGRKTPDLQDLTDRAITLILVYGDKMAAARSALNDVVVK